VKGDPLYRPSGPTSGSGASTASRTLIPEEDALWQRGASNAEYHYLGCAKTMALIGKAFAEAMLEMEKK
jgi:hypothetical protein